MSIETHYICDGCGEEIKGMFVSYSIMATNPEENQHFPECTYEPRHYTYRTLHFHEKCFSAEHVKRTI